MTKDEQEAVARVRAYVNEPRRADVVITGTGLTTADLRTILDALSARKEIDDDGSDAVVDRILKAWLDGEMDAAGTIEDLIEHIDALSAPFDEGDVERVARGIRGAPIMRNTYGLDAVDANNIARAALAALQSKGGE